LPASRARVEVVTVRIDIQQVEEAAKQLYIRALKLLPPDVKRGFDALVRGETDATARSSWRA